MNKLVSDKYSSFLLSMTKFFRDKSISFSKVCGMSTIGRRKETSIGTKILLTHKRIFRAKTILYVSRF